MDKKVKLAKLSPKNAVKVARDLKEMERIALSFIKLFENGK